VGAAGNDDDGGGDDDDEKRECPGVTGQSQLERCRVVVPRWNKDREDEG